MKKGIAYFALVSAMVFLVGLASASAQVMIIPASVDIKPMSCPNPLNVDMKGVLPVAILGTDEFDVTQIDPASIALEGVSPMRWSIEDITTPYNGDSQDDCFDCTEMSGDGYADLTLKFKAQEVAAALGEVEDGDCVMLTLTGKLLEDFGGYDFDGMDSVIIIKK